MAYIKLEDALQVCSEAEEWYTETNEQQCAVVSDDIYQQIANLPTADVAEVKHSMWKLYDDGSGCCKICNYHQKAVWDMDGWQEYCGHCGAKMDGERRTDDD